MGRSSLALPYDISVASSLFPLEFCPVSRCTDGLYGTQALPALNDDEGETRRFSGRFPVPMDRWAIQEEIPMPIDRWTIQEEIPCANGLVGYTGKDSLC